MPNWSFRLEYPLQTNSGIIYLDLMAYNSIEEIAIELKYKTRKVVANVSGEEFRLKSHAAQDLGRYDFFKDVSRLEQFAQSKVGRKGIAIFLTNDSSYWKPISNKDLGYAEYAMSENRSVAGILHWGDRAGEGTRKGRESEISLVNTYTLNWQNYSKIETNSYNEFRYLCLESNAS